MSTATIKKPVAKSPPPRKGEKWIGSLKGLRVKPGVDLTKPTSPVGK